MDVVKVTIQYSAVEGVLYCITLKASNLGVEQLYEAKVWVKESTGYIDLQDFHHVVDIKDVETICNKEKSGSNILVYYAKFAVKEYNRTNKHADVVFVKVVDARSSIKPVLDGKLYYITLEVSNFGLVQFYDALVWAKASNTWPWLELLDFKPIRFLSTRSR
ncbi:hypothetical protein J5N97_029768 [Dioscorea zingiberensis]|uniref:Cysteine proteinase inhibitor n=1 Tax=Dioscorea zingiberensis TaxID=325984 RepID=A0A9D5BWG7_9LILI|nr:hypothetical protein J5N97_029768 [Dioscorea zingiberensis]